MLNSKKKQTVRAKQILDFIKQPQQDAVVVSVIPTNNPFAVLELECFSPVWKKFYYSVTTMQDIHRGDILTFSRKENHLGGYDYKFIDNKTVNQIRQNGIDKILSDFNKQERHLLMIAAENKKSLTNTK